MSRVPLRVEKGLLDTSVLIAEESGRRLTTDDLPEDSFVCVVTLAELEAGVLVATDTSVRSRRLGTLRSLAAIAPLPVDAAAASAWARMRVELAAAGRRMGVNDLWIAAVAAANDLPVVTQDDDFDALVELDLVKVIKV